MRRTANKARPRLHVRRDREGPTVYFVENDTPQAIAAAQGRRIVLATGRGNTRLSLAEARDLHDMLNIALNRQGIVETWTKAGNTPPPPDWRIE